VKPTDSKYQNTVEFSYNVTLWDGRKGVAMDQLQLFPIWDHDLQSGLLFEGYRVDILCTQL